MTDRATEDLEAAAALTAFQALEKHRTQADERQRRAWRLQRLLRPGRRT